MSHNPDRTVTEPSTTIDQYDNHHDVNTNIVVRGVYATPPPRPKKSDRTDNPEQTGPGGQSRQNKYLFIGPPQGRMRESSNDDQYSNFFFIELRSPIGPGISR